MLAIFFYVSHFKEIQRVNEPEGAAGPNRNKSARHEIDCLHLLQIYWLLSKEHVLLQKVKYRRISTEAVTWRCSVKNVLLKISKNSQGNTPVPGSLF